MKRVLIGIAIAVFLAALCLYVVFDHSTLTQELTCSGHWKDQEQIAETAHVRLTEYRRWVHLWSNSDGQMSFQTEKRALGGHFGFVRKIGKGSLALYEFKNDEGGVLQGGYRVANGELTIKLWDNLIFVGTSCKPHAR